MLIKFSLFVNIYRETVEAQSFITTASILCTARLESQASVLQTLITILFANRVWQSTRECLLIMNGYTQIVVYKPMVASVLFGARFKLILSLNISAVANTQTASTFSVVLKEIQSRRNVEMFTTLSLMAFLLLEFNLGSLNGVAISLGARLTIIFIRYPHVPGGVSNWCRTPFSLSNIHDGRL